MSLASNLHEFLSIDHSNLLNSLALIPILAQVILVVTLIISYGISVGDGLTSPLPIISEMALFSPVTEIFSLGFIFALNLIALSLFLYLIKVYPRLNGHDTLYGYVKLIFYSTLVYYVGGMLVVVFKTVFSKLFLKN